MPDTQRTSMFRIVNRTFGIILLVTASLAVAFLFLSLADESFPVDIPSFAARSTARLGVTVTDRSDSWNWDWTAPPCTAAFIEWLAPQDVKNLDLTLINPEDHDLELPLRALYQPHAGQAAVAGAWCELASRAQTSDLVCVAAPLESTDPGAATTALTGAVAQAVTYTLNPHIFRETQGRSWNWVQWQPLVSPGTNGDWHSVCPTLSVETNHD